MEKSDYKPPPLSEFYWRVESKGGCPDADEVRGKRCMGCFYDCPWGSECIVTLPLSERAKKVTEKKAELTKTERKWAPKEDRDLYRVVSTYTRRAGFNIERTRKMLGMARDTAKKHLRRFFWMLYGEYNPKQLLNDWVKDSMKRGISDKGLSDLTGVPERTIRDKREALGLPRKRGRRKKAKTTN